MNRFDTHQAVIGLRNAGLPETQAEAIVRVLDAALSDVVTRDFLSTRLESLELRMTVKLGAMLLTAVGVLIASMRALLH